MICRRCCSIAQTYWSQDSLWMHFIFRLCIKNLLASLIWVCMCRSSSSFSTVKSSSVCVYVCICCVELRISRTSQASAAVAVGWAWRLSALWSTEISFSQWLACISPDSCISAHYLYQACECSEILLWAADGARSRTHADIRWPCCSFLQRTLIIHKQKMERCRSAALIR